MMDNTDRAIMQILKNQIYIQRALANLLMKVDDYGIVCKLRENVKETESMLV